MLKKTDQKGQYPEQRNDFWGLEFKTSIISGILRLVFFSGYPSSLILCKKVKVKSIQSLKERRNLDLVDLYSYIEGGKLLILAFSGGE